MNRHTLALWHLTLLTAIHFTVDMLSGTLPGFLPALRDRYSFSLTVGTVFLTTCSLSSNGLQIWAGTLRKTANRPLMIQLGLVLACAACFIGLVPQSGAFFSILLLVLLLGVGVALAHPEGLRGVCAIPEHSVSPEVATSLFMLAGFSGYATGPLLSGLLVQSWGFPGLLLLVIPPLALLVLFHRARIRLACDDNQCRPSAGSPGTTSPSPDSPSSHRPLKAAPLTFRQILVLATLINIGCSVVQSLLPSYLRDECGFSLGFAGFSAMLFGLGAGLGALGTSFLAKRRPVLEWLKLEMALGIPLLIFYLLFAHHRGAVILAPFSGMLVGAGFPQLVVLARSAPGGPGLGARMGIIVGGTWGVAGLFLMLAGLAGDLFTLRAAMFLAPVSFFAVLIGMLLTGKRGSRRRPGHA